MVQVATRYVYFFDEAQQALPHGASVRELLGGKGPNVAEMTRVLGADKVPAGFTITTEACVAYMKAGQEEPEGMAEEVENVQAAARTAATSTAHVADRFPRRGSQVVAAPRATPIARGTETTARTRTRAARSAASTSRRGLRGDRDTLLPGGAADARTTTRSSRRRSPTSRRAASARSAPTRPSPPPP